MPTFIIRYPEDQERKALISNLIGTLEKMNSLVVFDAICVVVQPGDPELELLKSLASGQVEPLQVQVPAALEFESAATDQPAATKQRECRNCGQLFTCDRPNGSRQIYCSPKCRNDWHSRQYRNKNQITVKASGGFNDGSGVIHGKLTLGRNR